MRCDEGASDRGPGPRGLPQGLVLFLASEGEGGRRRPGRGVTSEDRRYRKLSCRGSESEKQTLPGVWSVLEAVRTNSGG